MTTLTEAIDLVSQASNESRNKKVKALLEEAERLLIKAEELDPES